MHCAWFIRVRSCLSTKHLPALGISRLLKIFNRVDLPEPDAPTIAIISPGITSRSNPCSATTSRSATLYIFIRFSHVTSGTGICVPLLLIIAGQGDREGRSYHFCVGQGDPCSRTLPFLCRPGRPRGSPLPYPYLAPII